MKIDPPEKNFYLAAVSRVAGIGAGRLKKLLDFFQDPEEIWKAEPSSLEDSELPKAQIESFIGYRQKYPDAPEKMFEYCRERDINVITIHDEIYPEILREIKNPPTLLFYYGQIDSNARRIAMVGTRRVTNYGHRVAKELSEVLSQDFTIVSGAAAGIDTSSHWGALQFGRTVAVLGCGIDSVYPKENRELLKKISENGAVISEYSPFTLPNAGYFPARNRIISGLSLGTIVVEASEASGAIITADLARDQGRDVFVIPGDVDAESMRGCHRLAQRGAILISDHHDVIDFYNGKLKLEGNVKISRREENSNSIVETNSISEEKSVVEKKIEIELSEAEQKILDVLSSEPMFVDEIINETGIHPRKITTNLLKLENAKLIRKDNSDRYTKI